MPSPMPLSRFLTTPGLNSVNQGGEPATVMLRTVPGGGGAWLNFGTPETSSVTSNHSLVMVRFSVLPVWVCR